MDICVLHGISLDSLKHLIELQLANEKLEIHQYMSNSAPELIYSVILNYKGNRDVVTSVYS